MVGRNRLTGACLYRAQSTDLCCGRCVLLEFISCELGRRVVEEDLTWVETRQDRSLLRNTNS